jgi:hypothetical protein
MGKDQVGGDDDGLLLITLGEEMEEDLHLLRRLLDVADVVDDDAARSNCRRGTVPPARAPAGEGIPGARSTSSSSSGCHTVAINSVYEPVSAPGTRSAKILAEGAPRACGEFKECGSPSDLQAQCRTSRSLKCPSVNPKPWR